MATTKLSDLIVPEAWTPNFLLESPELVAFFNSGIVQLDDEITRLAQGEGSKFHLRHLNDLANTEENSSSDDPTQKSIADKLTGGEQLAVKLMRNKSWSSMDLSAALHSPDPILALRTLVGGYWAKRYQAALIAMLTGVLADNEANDGGDMIYDHTVGTHTDKTISGEAIINASATLGDASNQVGVISMHSVPFHNLQKRQLIAYQRDGDANIQFPTYLGKRVIVDDGMPVAGDAVSGYKFLTALYAPGAFRIGFGNPKTPVEVLRDPEAGNGEGEEQFYSRQHFILHPYGFSHIGSTFNPTNTNLKTATSWNRVFSRKQVPLAFLRTEG